MNWVRVKDGLPEHSETENLLLAYNGDAALVGRYNAKKGRFETWSIDGFESYAWVELKYVTHWQYIEFPKKED